MGVKLQAYPNEMCEDCILRGWVRRRYRHFCSGGPRRCCSCAESMGQQAHTPPYHRSPSRTSAFASRTLDLSL